MTGQQPSDQQEQNSRTGSFVINKHRIRSIASNLPGNLVNKDLLIAVGHELNSSKATKVGFEEVPADGDTVLPKAVGPVTRYNAHGRQIILRGQKKESFERVHAWTHNEWIGGGQSRTVTTYVSHTYQRFPRQQVPAPAQELVARIIDGKTVITIPGAIKYDGAHEAELINAINVLLEVFGYVEVFDADMNPVPDPKVVRRLNWTILPKGEKISEKTLEKVLSKSKRIRPVELNRQHKIAAYKPDEVAVGIAGFDGYIIYVFPRKNVAVLESLKYGNASYIIDNSNWEQLSKMTKGQLLSNKLVRAREVHTAGWTGRIEKILGDK